MLSPYTPAILELAPSQDPRHVEAYMRVEHSTLDHLSPERFAAEVAVAVMCVTEGGEEMAERIAQSFGC